MCSRKVCSSWGLLLLFALAAAFSGQVGGECDVSQGSWQYDNSTQPAYPACNLYPCLGPRFEKINKYTWQAPGCDIQKLDPWVLLEMLRGKAIAFVGDSISKNIFSSIVCKVSSVIYTYKFHQVFNYDNHTMAAYYIPAYSASIVSVNSPYFVKQGEPSKPGEHVVHLDEVDGPWANHLANFHYLVFSGMRSFRKQSNRFLIGGADQSNMPPEDAIVKSLETVRDYLDQNNYSGKAVFTTYLPDHSSSVFNPALGKMNCAGIGRPFNETELQYASTQTPAVPIREKQLKVFQGNPKWKILDVTRLALLRPDSHEGSNEGIPFLSIGDCTHWCLPGVPDTWANILFSLLTDKM